LTAGPAPADTGFVTYANPMAADLGWWRYSTEWALVA